MMKKILSFIVILLIMGCTSKEQKTTETASAAEVKEITQTPKETTTSGTTTTTTQQEKTIEQQKTTTNQQYIAELAHIPRNTYRSFTYKGEEAFVVNLDGTTLKAYYKTCPESDGELRFETGMLKCMTDLVEYSPLTGEVTRGKTTVSAPQIPVKVEDGKVYAILD